jgi:hypothetical protein
VGRDPRRDFLKYQRVLSQVITGTLKRGFGLKYNRLTLKEKNSKGHKEQRVSFP